MRSGAIAALLVEKLRTGRGADDRRASLSVRSIAVCISSGSGTQWGEALVDIRPVVLASQLMKLSMMRGSLA
jgi:hypothetical protein